METSKASGITWKHIIFCIVLLIVFVLTIGIHTDAEGNTEPMVAANDSDVVPLQNTITNNVYSFSLESASFENEVILAGPKEEVVVEDTNISKLNNYITTNAEKIEFYSKAFGVKCEDIITDLYKRHENSDKEFEITNIGLLLDKNGNIKVYENEEYGLVEYFYNFVKKNPKKVNNKRVPYRGKAEYVENLIIYYTSNVYKNVDTNIALSIGAAESGYYKVKYMLASNNIYGGMSSKGLIKYKNIEYGVLSYVRMLSRRYFGKGLNTIQSIGRVYCPVRDNNGYKTASPHWINLVSTAMKKYNNVNKQIETKDLIVKEEKC